MKFFSRNLMWSQGTSLVIGTVVAAFCALFFYPKALLGIVPLFCFFLFFFRNPVRVCTSAFCNDQALIAPCDGKVLEITPLSDDTMFAYKIAIFLSPLDVHVNWIPCAGVIEKIVYHKGSFYPAFLPKSSELNERNDVDIRSKQGSLLRVRQITGTLARTIACWVAQGQSVQAGDTFGMMKFGSRIDLFLPKNVTITIQEQERVYGGQTVIAQWV